MALTTVRPEGMGFNTGRRNLIINGAMQVAQRGTSTSLVHDGTISNFSPDRFQFQLNNTLDELEGTLAQVTDSPDGFSNSLKWTTTEPEGAIDADHYVSLFQKIEGQNLQHIKNGSSGALSLTLSFYVKSSQTGTFGVNLYKDDSTSRIINSTYTIASANTWEYKTITFAGDTSGGGINNDNGIGFYCSWHLAAGSNFDSVNSTSWANYSTTNWAGGHAQDGVITTDNATWQITGIQLEVGSNASDFEHRSFGEELSLCQRYYEEVGSGVGRAVSASQAELIMTYQVPKRAAGTITLNNGTGGITEMLRSQSNITSINGAFVATTKYHAQRMTSSDTGMNNGSMVVLMKEDAIAVDSEL